ncbi:AbiV family abortive infection protein [Zhouia amylolytica]|uniref:AbiV family abortive infection protein n=1 Tax=Zhouia amylolytica TaxID=376730 RepID=UPI0020CDBC2C|nr:AbiV family abortive infection protein [Zhouia amylolytica]MCQ0113088.1 AbiV family abortive infection protein [Zhouia amylolytica]
MKTFINLSSKTSSNLDDRIYKNALQLKKDALLIAQKRSSHSSATSLLVLSSEELIKAILVLLHSKGYEVYKIKGAKKFFSDHKIRHQIAQLVEMGVGFINSIEIWEIEKSKQKLFNTKYKLLNTVLNGFLDLAEASKPLMQSIDRIKKIEEFNTLKNNGLYVDYRDELIYPQKSIGKEKFEETKLLIDRMFSFYKGVRILFHPSLVKHIQQKEIDKHQEDLKFFINDALKGFEFDRI